jgi:phosphatidylserine decarboxylase
MKTTTQFIAEESWETIGIFFISGVVLDSIDFDLLSNLAFFLAFFTAFIYRNPEITPNKEAKIVSPISGEIYAVKQEGEATQLFINKSLLDNSILRAPISCDLKYSKTEGLNLHPTSVLAKKLNANMQFTFDDISLDIIAGTCSDTLELKEMQSVYRGDRIGIVTQAMAILTLHNDTTNLKIGDKVKAGITPIVL